MTLEQARQRERTMASKHPSQRPRRNNDTPASADPWWEEPNQPVIAVHSLERFHFLWNRPTVGADVALVFQTASGRLKAYPPQQLPTRGELVGSGFRTLYEVNLASHHLTFAHRLPAEGDVFHFQAETDVTWRVLRPEVVVQHGVRDVRTLVEPRLVPRLRSVTRRFPIDACAAAEAAVQEALAETPIAPVEGLEVTCAVRISPDAEATAHHAKLRSIDHAKTTMREEHELELLRTEQRQRLLDKKTEFYRGLLEQGDIASWALQIAHNPADLPLAHAALRDDQREAMRNQIHLIETIMTGGHIEDHHMEEPARMVVDTLKALLNETSRGQSRNPLIGRQQIEAPRNNDGDAPRRGSRRRGPRGELE
ncbi:hypothetical protein [Allostreptomyces psammosilenae]|uniref:Band 7 domain-containing protein n=1 Tax=Allostreptomyces psammosilenae TaxID=1892865 RepID=A0A852ZW10_9ACTN|nr:hypothetical protein [Allostreptomyces psammosilenae]NYI05847.1 hypothetical protein [Allostreptomyces psammosilenae]